MTREHSPGFAVLLREHRGAAALTQEQLAERSGVSVRAISDLERGAKTRPQRVTIRLLADGLGLTEEERKALEGAVPSRHRPFNRADQSLDPPSSEELPPPTNLLSEPTPFVGRKGEMASLGQLLDRPSVRLVTMTGSGGSGKSRLALEIARARLMGYEDGVFWVSLAPLADPALVAPTIAAVLGIKDGGVLSPLAILERSLRQKHLLLVLDNFEHVLEAAPVVSALLRSCTSLQILVTSRAILHLAAEQEFPVPPLSLPALTLVPDLEVLSQSDSAALFVNRAQAARPDFVLTHENASYVAAICHRLDGLPLAIELAAARIRVLPPQALLGRLSRRFEILTGGARDRPTRQQTIRGAIDWSYALLSPAEQILFARLSAFAGGWTLEGAEAVCNGEGDLAIEVLDGLTSLVEQSLLLQEGRSHSRFSMLETIREYAAEKLEERAETQTIQGLHARYFLDFVEEIRPHLDGEGQVEGLDRLEEEHNNLRAAIDWACSSGDVELGLRLAIAAEYLYMRGHSAEMASWFERLLAVEEGNTTLVTPSLRAEALQLGAAYAISERGNVEQGRALTDELMALIDELRDAREIAYRLQGVGQLLTWVGEYARAVTVIERALSIFRELNDTAGLGVVLVDLGTIARMQGDAPRVIEVSEEGLRSSREAHNGPPIVGALHNLGVAARMQGDLYRARTLCTEALELARQIGLVSSRRVLMVTLASIARDLGDLDEAETFLTEALRVGVTSDFQIEVTAMSLEGMAGLAAARTQGKRAAVLFGAANKLREGIGRLAWAVTGAAYERDLASARAAAGEEHFSRAWAEGYAMTMDGAIAYALGDVPGRSRAASGGDFAV